MKAKLLFILLSILFIFPMEGAIAQRRKSHLQYHFNRRENVTRVPLVFDMTIQEQNGILNILFHSPLSDAEITITDKDGNIVINESKSLIYEGKTLYIYSADNYPYSIEITSPILDLTGEITLE